MVRPEELRRERIELLTLPIHSLAGVGTVDLGHGQGRLVEFITCPEGVHRTYYWSRR